MQFFLSPKLPSMCRSVHNCEDCVESSECWQTKLGGNTSSLTIFTVTSADIIAQLSGIALYWRQSFLFLFLLSLHFFYFFSTPVQTSSAPLECMLLNACFCFPQFLAVLWALENGGKRHDDSQAWSSDKSLEELQRRHIYSDPLYMRTKFQTSDWPHNGPSRGSNAFLYVYRVRRWV